MFAAISLKRVAIAVGVIVVAAFVTLVAFSFLMPTATVREAVANEIRTVTGLDPVLRGDFSVSLFPSGTVSFHNVVLGDDRSGEPAVMADELIARLRYFPLLAGRIEIADVTLVRPTITVTFRSDGQSNWSGLLGSLAHALAPNPDRRATFSEIGISDGVIVMHDIDRGFVDRLTNVELQVAWPSISRSFGANGHFMWRGETIEAGLTLSDFLAALSGDQSGVKLRLAGDPLKLVFDGSASTHPTVKAEGTLSVDAPSLRDAMLWAGRSNIPFGGFGRFALRAQTSVVGGVISLSGANIDLDDNRAEGALTLSSGDLHLVQATLASDTLDLTPYVSGVRLLAANKRNWDQLPITLDGIEDLNLDLRLSAARIKVAQAELGRTAVAASMRDGKLDVTIGEAQAFGGVVKGSLGLAIADGGVAANSHLQFVDVDLATCLRDLFGVQKLTGRGNMAMNVGGSGASVLALTNTLDGTVNVTAHSGALLGINVEQLLRRLERRPLSGSGDFRSGQTPFDELVVNLKIDQGNVSVDDMHANGPAVRLAVSGQASVPTRDLDLKGTATLVAADADNQFDLPFVVQGRWDDPIMLPDAQSLIRHSGAAAPLLDAVKSHPSAGDAVRSVIDKLMANPSGNAAPPASPPKDSQ